MVTNETDYIASNGVTVRVTPALGYVVGDPPGPKTIIAADSHSSALREYFTMCESAPVTDLDVHVALNSFFDTERNWETWDPVQIDAMRRTLEQARLPASREEAEAFRRVAAARERVRERLDRTYGPEAPAQHFSSGRDRKAWSALSAFLFVDVRRRDLGLPSLSAAESDVLAWAIVTAFKVRGRR